MKKPSFQCMDWQTDLLGKQRSYDKTHSRLLDNMHSKVISA